MIDIERFIESPAWAQAQSHDKRCRLVAAYLRANTPRDARSDLDRPCKVRRPHLDGFTRAMQDEWIRWPWDLTVMTLALVAWTPRGDAIVKLWRASRAIEWHLLTREGLKERLTRDTWPEHVAFRVEDAEG